MRLPTSIALALPAFAALAGTPTGSGDAIRNSVRSFVESETRQLGPGVSIEIPPLDARTRVSECASLEVFVPAGTRLWGKSRVGVRCTAPKQWLIYQPVSIKVSGYFLASNRQINAGETLSDPDVRREAGELTALPDDVLVAADELRGRKVRKAIAADQPIRKDHLQRDVIFRQGDKIRIVVRGNGFSVSSEGTALVNGYEGEVARVKNAAGRTVEGRVRAAGHVEITP
jgi:flagella basal body P-ring formation protein FlgA